MAALLGALALAGWTSRGDQWQPSVLLIALTVFAVVSDALTVNGRGIRVSGSFIAIVLAMVVLGPAPAVVVALASISFDAARARSGMGDLLHNAAAYAVFALAGGLAFSLLEPSLDGDAVLRASAIVAIFMITNVLNFVLVVAPMAFTDHGRSFAQDARDTLAPLLPSQLAASALTATVDALFHRFGSTSIVLAAVVVLVFQHLLRTTMLSVERADELEERTRELARMQVGLITTVLRTLSLRDKMTARHSAAVARYAREVARELGLDAAAQEQIHTAGLLHDIGKFIFPDSILMSSSRLTDEEFEIVKRHPEQGARLVRRIQGYDAIAEIILCHHERVDGRGYPNGISGDDIPIGSRIIAVCDTYDVMTSRDSYREPVTPAVALAELRRVAGTQLDPAIVVKFIDLITRRGVAFRHTDDVDFEAELDQETKVAEFARPRQLAA